jgi:hypothetical protein
MGLEQRDDLVMGRRLGGATRAPDDALGAPQGVQDGLLVRVDGRREERPGPPRAVHARAEPNGLGGTTQ